VRIEIEDAGSVLGLIESYSCGWYIALVSKNGL
jgi:hypothetical protein